MTQPEPYASRREVDQLRSDLQRIDDHGTRGVGAIQAQLTDLVKDVTELKTDMNVRFATHQKEHEDDARARLAGRRWLIGTAIAGIVAMAAVITLLVDIASKLHR